MKAVRQAGIIFRTSCTRIAARDEDGCVEAAALLLPTHVYYVQLVLATFTQLAERVTDQPTSTHVVHT